MMKLRLKKVLFVFAFLFLFIASFFCISFSSLAIKSTDDFKQFSRSRSSSRTSIKDAAGEDICEQNNVRIRTNPINGFTSTKTSDGRIEYALCDVKNQSTNRWDPGIVALDSNEKILAQWKTSDITDSTIRGDYFTTSICIGEDDHEIFVLMAIKDITKALEDAFVGGKFKPIFINKLKLNLKSKRFDALRLFEFSYPTSRVEWGPAGWFSRDGIYRKLENYWLDTYTNRYLVGSLGYIHFLSYGHLFGYNKNVINNSVHDEFIMLPALFNNHDTHNGGLYSPMFSDDNGHYSRTSFSHLQFWKSTLRNSSYTYRKASDGEKNILGSGQGSFSERVMSVIKGMLKIFDEYVERRPFYASIKSTILAQPGWCIFRPNAERKYTFVSPMFGESGHGARGDFGGLFTQFESIRDNNGRRIFKAVRLFAGIESVVFPKITHVAHFTADWNWFAAENIATYQIRNRFDYVYISDDKEGKAASLAKPYLSDFNWRITQRISLAKDQTTHFSVFPLNESTDENKPFDLTATNFLARATAISTNTPFLFISMNDCLKIHIHKRADSNWNNPNGFLPKLVYSNLNSHDVLFLLPFKMPRLRGEGILVVTKKALIIYRTYAYNGDFQLINPQKILYFEEEISEFTIRSIFFHNQATEVEENLIRVSMGVSQNQWNEFKFLTFSLEWDAEGELLRPLECTPTSTIIVRDDLPQNYKMKSSHEMASVNGLELIKNFSPNNDDFQCEVNGNKCAEFYLVVKHVSGGYSENEQNAIAICLKIKTGNEIRTGFIRKESTKEIEGLGNTYVVYSGLSDGKKYFALFKSRNEVKKLPISEYTVEQIYDMYSDPKNTTIRDQLNNLVEIEPAELATDWKYNVRIVDANKESNTLSLEAMLSVGEYSEPLRLKEAKETSIKMYSDVFYKPSLTWVYIVIAVVVGIVIILSLGLGIGLPMHKQSKINIINARITNKRIDRLSDAVSTSMKRILDVTSSMQSQQAKLLHETQRIGQNATKFSQNSSSQPSTYTSSSDEKYHISPPKKSADEYPQYPKIPPHHKT